ncbi:MAG: ATP-binding cassette domain-containing protein [Thermodesulfobacteriota bacterium]
MLNINGLTIVHGKRDLFRNVSAQITGQDKIGLVGVNGAGKSTLLKLIAGLIDSDPGVVVRSKYATVGYLPQEITDFPEHRTLYDEAVTAFEEVWRKKDELDEVNQRLATAQPDSPAFAELLNEQGELQQQLDQADIFSIKAKTEKVLLGLGFKEADLDRPCASFSGGWLMRLMLAKLLLIRPAYLLLDEPTNHLDIESLGWLESFLRGYNGAVILISHDRAFLDAVTDTTWELSLGRLTVYKGNYSRYLVDREERLKIQRAAYDNQQAQIQQTMRFVQRFRAKSTKAKQVQSRLKQLSKMDRIELDESEATVAFTFPPAAPSGRDVLTIQHLAKNFADKKVLVDVCFELQRGDKLAVIGVNGAGKSTLVKLLAGLHRPDAGSIRFGHNVAISYFGQHQAQELPQDFTVLQTLSSVEGERSITQERTLLAAFLFRDEDVDKKVRVLSGGEKSRLALARMMITPGNLLVMDEPTNHLDMASQEILQYALSQYDGTIIVVSHNRYFLNQFINKVLVIRDGRAEIHHGNLQEYLTRQGAEAEHQEEAPAGSDGENKGTPAAPASKKDIRRQQAELRQERSAKIRRFREAVEEAEHHLEKLEARKKQLETVLADPETYKSDQFAPLSQEYSEIGGRIDRWYYKWEQAQAEVDRIEAEYAGRLETLETTG